MMTVLKAYIGGTWVPLTGAPSIAATQAALPAASSNVGRVFYVSGTATLYVSDGTQWRLAYGDTGVRKLAAGDSADPNWTGASIRIRRLNNTVYLTGYLGCSIAGQATTAVISVYLLPLGFRAPVMSTYFAGIAGLGTTIPAWPTILSPGTALANTVTVQPVSGTTGRPATFAVNDRLILSCSWTTTDSWPSTLPGTAEGTIPGLLDDD